MNPKPVPKVKSDNSDSNRSEKSSEDEGNKENQKERNDNMEDKKIIIEKVQPIIERLYGGSTLAFEAKKADIKVKKEL